MTIDKTLPEPVQKFLESGGTLEEIRLSAQGLWTHEGLDFENQKIIDLFHRSVGRTEGGTWILSVGRFTYPITVDDCGFFVRHVDFSESPTLLLSDDTVEPLIAETLTYEDPGKLYCTVKNGDFRARFWKGAYLVFADRFEERDGGVYWGNHRLL